MTWNTMWSFFLIALLGVTVSQAQPRITGLSGNLDEGASVILGGSGFGVKSTSAPMKFENFEGSAAGSYIGSEGYWSLRTDNTDSRKPTYSNEFSRSANSPQTAKFPLETLHDYAIKSGLDFSSGRIYYDYWVRFTWASSTVRHQIKLARLGSGTSDSYIYPHFVTEHWIGGSNCYSDARTGAICGASGMTDWDYDCPPVGEWSHIQISIDYGTASGNDAFYEIWQDGVYKGGDSGFSWFCGTDPTFQQVWVGGYLGNTDQDGMTTTIYYDDVYFDDTWARVEIGDDSDYNSCTHREIQIPSSWSSGAIEVTMNLGTYQTGDTAYLFITDSEGNVNSEGYAITVGQSETANIPPSITVLEPTAQSSISTLIEWVELAGSASDEGSLAEVRWNNAQGDSGIALNSSGNWSSWSVPVIDLVPGENVITMTAEDEFGLTNIDVITVIYDLGPPGMPGQPVNEVRTE